MKKGAATSKKEGSASPKKDVSPKKDNTKSAKNNTSSEPPKSPFIAKVFSVFFMILAWTVEAIGGLFYPLLLILGSLLVPTNEGNYIVHTPGLPLVLVGLGFAAVFMLTGLILFHKKKTKWAFIFMITAAVLFIACFIGISSLFINKNSAISLDYRGEYKLTQAKLIWRHGIPVLIPVFAMLSMVVKNVASERKLFKEAIDEIKEDEKKGKKVSLD